VSLSPYPLSEPLLQIRPPFHFSRYEIHQKLVNFLVPVPNVSVNEDTTNELFNSLFGQKNSGGLGASKADESADEHQQEDDVVPSEDERIF